MLAAKLQMKADETNRAMYAAEMEMSEKEKADSRKIRQARAGKALADNTAAAAERASKAAALASTGKSEAAAGPIGTSANELFGGDGGGGNSKIFNALNPTPLHKETAAERRERTEDTNDIGVAGSRGGGGGVDSGEVVTGFGDDGDDDDDDWSDDGEFNDDDLELDPQFAANLAKSRAKRESDAKANAGSLKDQFAAQQAKVEASRSKEMAVINARKKIERKQAEKALATIIADSKRRVGSITFNMDFLLNADADGDGMMSLEEALAQGVTEETFLAMDADGNGQVTKEEFQAWLEAGRLNPPLATDNLLENTWWGYSDIVLSGRGGTLAAFCLC